MMAVLLEAFLIFSIIWECQLIWVCFKFNRKILTPALIRALIWLDFSVAGPRVATIFVFLSVFIFYVYLIDGFYSIKKRAVKAEDSQGLLIFIFNAIMPINNGRLK